MISAKFLWGNVFFGEKLQLDPKISNFEFFESALYMKLVNIPLTLFIVMMLIGILSSIEAS